MLRFMFLASFAWMSSFINAQHIVSCDRTADSLELINLYKKFRGDSWFDKTNWLTSNPIDTWYGITLNASGCVDSIQLGNNNLNGALYDLNFPNATIIYLDSNKINKTIPDFSHLSNLKILHLEHNQLSGTIPDFTSLSGLNYLNVSQNQLSGSIPDFSKLLNLNILNLGYNFLDGNIPDFSNLPNLVEIDFGFNLLTGSIPDFSKLAKLQVMVIHANKLTGAIPDFSKIPNLQYLLSAYNQLSGPVPNFSKLPKMYQLSLADNLLTGNIPNFSSMPNLGIIYLSYNKLTGSIPNFSKLPNLVILNLGHNNLTGAIPDFMKSPFLLWIVLSYNQLTGKIPDYNASKSNLTEMELDNNLLEGSIPFYPNFDRFDISNNKYTFEDIFNSNNIGIIPEFWYAPQLPFYKDTTFRIKKNVPYTIDLGIDKDLPDNSYSWQKDSSFWLIPAPNQINSNKLIFSNPQSSDAARYYAIVNNIGAPLLYISSHIISLQVCDEQSDSMELVKLYNATDGSHWKNNSNWLQPGSRIQNWYGVHADAFGCVRKLDLTDNNLNGTLPALKMNTLDTLILNQNTINGNIPELETPFIKWLELGNNNLTGDFPKNIGKLYDMNGLNLSSNGITGEVPPDLGDLCELKMLRINKNKIKGELPEKLTLLVNLEVGQVNFSDNNIDSLKDKLIWFCPFGDSILESNPSFNRFLGICNVECEGKEFTELKNFPWIVDTVQQLNCNDSNCVLSKSYAGFVIVRGLTVFYTLNRCYLSIGPPPVFNDVVKFYDCGGHLLEIATNKTDTFFTKFGAIEKQEFDSLKYDVQWQCGQTLNITTATQDSKSNGKIYSDGVINIQCWPNPATIQLNCKAGDDINPGSLLIYDLQGRQYQLQAEMNHHQIRIDATLLHEGIYFISILGKSGRYLGKILVR